VELPPSPEKLCEEAQRRYWAVKSLVDSDQSSDKATWDSFTKAQREDINGVIEMLRSAAGQNRAHAQFTLGVLSECGHGLKRDYAEAAFWYEKAAEQGNASAQDNLGTMYYSGQGVKQDYGEAVRWYQIAAAHRNASAQANTGSM